MHTFKGDGYGHGECRHCGEVEELHGDVVQNAIKAERERLRSLVEAAGSHLALEAFDAGLHGTMLTEHDER